MHPEGEQTGVIPTRRPESEDDPTEREPEESWLRGFVVHPPFNSLLLGGLSYPIGYWVIGGSTGHLVARIGGLLVLAAYTGELVRRLRAKSGGDG